MGVYDQINLAEPIGGQLPGYDPDRLGTPAHEATWQTKDIGAPFMHRFRITAEGALEKYCRETEEIPESEWTDEQRERIKRVRNADENASLSSSLGQPPTRTAEEYWERVPDWHGVFEFYDYFDVGEERSEQWRYQAQFVHGELNRISQLNPVPEQEKSGIVEFGVGIDEGVAETYRGRIQEILDEDRELLDRLADAKDLFHGEGTLAHETDDEWSGRMEIEVWSNEPDDHEIPTVLLEGWSARADQDRCEFEINLDPGYARSLGVELVKMADKAEDVDRTV
jgi:hypothetical protein